MLESIVSSAGRARSFEMRGRKPRDRNRSKAEAASPRRRAECPAACTRTSGAIKLWTSLWHQARRRFNTASSHTASRALDHRVPVRLDPPVRRCLLCCLCRSTCPAAPQKSLESNVARLRASRKVADLFLHFADALNAALTRTPQARLTQHFLRVPAF